MYPQLPVFLSWLFLELLKGIFIYGCKTHQAFSKLNLPRGFLGAEYKYPAGRGVVFGGGNFKGFSGTG